jgi:hypothetical protein
MAAALVRETRRGSWVSGGAEEVGWVAGVGLMRLGCARAWAREFLLSHFFIFTWQI